MKTAFLSVLALVILVVFVIVPARKAKAQIQGTEQQNEIAFNRLQAYITTQEADAIYAMLTDEFKKQLSSSVFNGFLTGNIFPLGRINNATLLGYKKGVSTYKADFAKAQREVAIATDAQGRIAMLTFRPYTGDAQKARKDHTVATSNPLHTSFEKSIDSIATGYIGMKHTVGLMIGILKDGKESIYGYGETTKGNGRIPDANTLFEIGSISKTFTATLLAYYINEHKIRLDDPITKYLPDSVAANSNLNAITIEMLSNHTSGLPSVPVNMYLGNKQDKLNPYKDYSKEMMFTFLKYYSSGNKPGTEYGYSNLAVGLLGVILERISGMAYEQMVKTVICKPLGMGHTVQHIDEKLMTNMVSVYNEQGEHVPMWDFDAIAGAGCLRSTVSDLLRYANANMQNDKTTLHKAMQLTHVVTSRKEPQVGLGWHYMRDAPMLWHNGGTGGSCSFLAFYPDKKLAFVVLSNSEESVDDIGMELAALLLTR